MQNQLKSKESRWTILKLLKWAAAYFKSHRIENPRAAAEILLAHTLRKERIDLYVCYDQPLGSKELQYFKTLIKRRIDREPVAYITGIKEFWSLELEVNPDVLIPRPETECLVEAVCGKISGDFRQVPRRILDLGTGSGAIVLALASRARGALFFASDRSARAVRLARQNARRHRLENRIHFFCGDWLKALKSGGSGFDIIVSNPPYIKTGLIAGLQPEVCRYEPVQALDGGEDGLDSLRLIIHQAPRYLNDGGRLFLEIGFDQKQGVQDIITESGGYDEIVFGQDYSGLDRVVSMKKKG
ncbi:MAG: peptide chain release factor N(5)-glutamine methyltransferase [Thermodesulfobacteriota bacterium]